jgi:hypothetical protein
MIDRAATLDVAMNQIMKQRIYLCRGNVGIGAKISGRTKGRTGVPPLAPPGFEIVQDRIDPTVANVGIAVQIPGAIEQAGLPKLLELAAAAAAPLRGFCEVGRSRKPPQQVLDH